MDIEKCEQIVTELRELEPKVYAWFDADGELSGALDFETEIYRTRLYQFDPAQLAEAISTTINQVRALEKAAERSNKAFCMAINHAISLGLEAGDFLRCWNEGDWDGCREFDFPEEAIEVSRDPAGT